MATKKEVLQYVRTLAEQKVITKEELTEAYNSGSGIKTNIVLVKKITVTEILYYIGATVVLLGILILLWQNWSALGFRTRVLSTFGSGIVAYIVGLTLSRNEQTKTVSSAFYLIFALATPVGIWIIFNNAGFDASSFGTQSIISGMMLSACVLSLTVFRKNIFTLFSILFGTWFFFSITSWMVVGTLYFSNDWKFYMYRILIAGAAYVLIGYAFSKNKYAELSESLYSLGILGFLGAALALGEWKPNQNIFWELVYPGLFFGSLFFSVHIKSKAFLTLGTIFFMIYILKITSEYFSASLSWPLTLVIAGLAMIGVGYASILIKKRYILSK